MKKFTTIFALLFAMVATAFAEHVETSDARRAAETFLKNNGAKAAELRDISEEAGFANLYVFTTEHSFVVMAADNCVRPILGYSLTDKFITENMPDHVRWWIQQYSDQIEFAIENSLCPDATSALEWERLISGKPAKEVTYVVVSPLLSTEWDQNYPYNYFCPSASSGPGGHVYAGCVATAMAQVMKFWNYPTTGQGSHSYNHSTYGDITVNFGATTYNWTSMPSSISSSSSQTYINSIATLIYHCGVSVDMNYGSGSSGASSSKVPGAMIDYFRYAPSATLKSKAAYTDAQWIVLLKSELDEGRPLYYSGSNENSGHAFVCDGYRSDDYFHFNWGWSGYQNNYWAIGALNPGSGGSGSGAGTYNMNNAIVAYAEPLSSLTAPTLTAVEADGVINLSWNAISGATSYDVYRDNVKVLNGTTSLTYTDNDVEFGEIHEYYVRAVSSTQRSNPSNFVNIKSTYRNLAPSNLTASWSSNNVTLNWTGYAGGASTDLRYGSSYEGGAFGYGGSNDTYWGQCYPASALSAYGGMVINKVSVYIRTTGNYVLYLYKDNTYNESNKLKEVSFTASATGWKDVVLSSPVNLDVTKDLWVVFYSSSAISYPAAYGSYYGSDVQYARYINSSLSSISYSYVDDNISWLIKTYITDGTYTYNIYRNGSSIASNVSNTYYNDNGLANGSYTYYVKTNYYGGESDASNSVTVNVGSTTNYTISASVNPSSAGTITGAGTYAGGSTCTLTASANTGYTFINWTKNGTEVSTNSTYSFTVTGNATYVANFSYEQYMISVSASPAAGGTVSGGGAYTYGQSCTLTATPNSGYTFVNWTRNGSSVSTSPTYNFTVTQSDEYIAHFEGAGCDVVFDLEDSYGDGWNGNKLVVSYGSTYEQLTFTTGYSASYTLNIPDGSHVTLGWIAGSYTSECSFTVSYGNGDMIYEGSNLSSSFSYEFDVACPVTGITQTTHFVNGWTWWSTYIEEDGGSCLTQLENGLGTSGQVIKNQSASLTHIGSSWYGGFTSLDNAQTYRVKTNAAVDVDITGPAVATASHPVTLKPNWTWIGYPCTSSMSVATALAGITPTAGDVLKSQTSSTVYIGTTWVGSLNTITPGMGLMYYSKKTSNMTLVYPTAKGEETKPNLTPENNHWQPDMAAYPDNMTVLAVVEMNDMELQGENYELAAFANGECRGSVQLLYIEPLNRYMAILTVAGDAETELRFGLYDVTTGEEYLNANETLTYQSNAIVGDLDAPLTIRFRSNTGLDELSSMVKVFPNPVDRGTQFSVDLPTKQTEAVRVEVLNMMGSILSTETATGQPAVFKAPDTPGVYTLRIILNSKETCCRKLVVK